MKLLRPTPHGPTTAAFLCPACSAIDPDEREHVVRIEPGHWSLSGTSEAPTIAPSIRAEWVFCQWDSSGRPIAETRRTVVCHSFVRGGKIEYLSDCTHAMASQTVDLPDYQR